jgi:hypothetical protein
MLRRPRHSKIEVVEPKEEEEEQEQEISVHKGVWLLTEFGRQ